MTERRTNAIIGAAAVTAVVVLVYLLALYLGGSFEPGYEVTARFARAGQLLRSGSDVKLRGVLVGSVSKIDIERTGKARVTMRLFNEHEIPDNVNAAIRAKTLFGEKYVELRIPAHRSGSHLVAGDEIPESRTIPPFEVETILEKGVPILEAVDPEAFGAALHALAEAFSGNEQALRRATVQGEHLLSATERTLPNLERNLVHLQHFASALNQSDDELLEALGGLAAIGDALRDHPEEFRETLEALVPLARDLGDVLTARERDLADLAGKGRPVLEAVAARAPKLPSLVGLLDGFLGVWVKDLSEGPYWRIAVTDPPVFTGDPYAPGEEPSPRQAAVRIMATGPHALPTDLLELALTPVPTDEIEKQSSRLGLRVGVRTP